MTLIFLRKLESVVRGLKEMEIEDKYLSAENCQDGDIITIQDEGVKEVKTSKRDNKPYVVYNFLIDNGRYQQTYTPGSLALDVMTKAWGRETKNWINKKFQVKIVQTISFGKPVNVIVPNPL